VFEFMGMITYNITTILGLHLLNTWKAFDKCNNTNVKGDARMNRFISRVMWVIIILGGIFFYEGVTSVVDSKKTPVDFNSLKESDLQSNMIVEGYINYNFGSFEEEYRTTYGIKTGDSIYNYLIPIGDGKYMGLKNDTEEQRQVLDKQMNDTFNSLNGSKVTPQTFYFKGRVKALTAQEVGFMRDYIISMGYTQSQAEQYMCKYYIECADFGGGMIKTVIGAVMLVIGLACLIGPSVAEAREQKRKQSMFNNLEAQSTNTYSSSVVQSSYTSEPFVDSTDSINNQEYEEPNWSNSWADDNETSSGGTSSTGLKLKM